MSTLLTILVVILAVWAMIVASLLLAVRLRSHSSNPASPTQSTTPIQTSDETVLKMMTAMNSAWGAQMEATRQMVSDLTLGRESQSQTGMPETWQMQSARPIDYDDDSTPLSPGIEAVLEREEHETEHHRLQTERRELQEQLAEKQAELDRLTLEQSSETGPWSNGSDPKHARTD